MNARLKPAERRKQILEAAVPLAEKFGYNALTRDLIAEEAGVSGSVLNYHFSTMARFKRALVRHAVKVENLTIIAQAVLGGEKIPMGLRRRALDSLR